MANHLLLSSISSALLYDPCDENLKMHSSLPSSGVAIIGAVSSRTAFCRLPTEILALIFEQLTQDDIRRSKVYTVSHTVSALCTSLLERSITLASKSLRRFPPLDEYPVKRLDPEQSTRIYSSFYSNLRHLKLDLTCPSIDHLATQSTHNIRPSKLTNSDLDASLNHLAAFLRQCNNLRALKITTVRHGPGFGKPSRDPTFLSTNALIGLLEALSGSVNLTHLEIDTQDCEHSSWTLAHSDMRACNEHFCTILARTVATMPNLRTLKVCRNDMCEKICKFDRWLDGKHHPSLETIVLDIRLPYQQLVGDGCYESRSRPCECSCDCSTCTPIAENHALLDAQFARAATSSAHYRLKTISSDATILKRSPISTNAFRDVSGLEKTVPSVPFFAPAMANSGTLNISEQLSRYYVDILLGALWHVLHSGSIRSNAKMVQLVTRCDLKRDTGTRQWNVLTGEYVDCPPSSN